MDEEERTRCFEIPLFYEEDTRLVITLQNKDESGGSRLHLQLQLRRLKADPFPHSEKKIEEASGPGRSAALETHLPSVLWKNCEGERFHNPVFLLVTVGLDFGASAPFELQWRSAQDTEFHSERTVTLMRKFKEIIGAAHDREAQHQSRDGRAVWAGDPDGTSLTYGEVSFLSFSKILELANIANGETFFDLGSGAGNACLAAILLEPGLSCCDGIELLPGLHDMSEKMRTVTGNEGVMSFILGSMLDFDWSGYDVVYAASICFSQELLKGISLKLPMLKKGARYISMVDPELDEATFRVTASGSFAMSWGVLKVSVFTRQ